jgi:phosphoserine aminotransferase
MNVTFHLPTPELLARFLKDGGAAGLYALKGHARLGGVRASLYNAMPMEGAEALACFMEEFQRKHG